MATGLDPDRLEGLFCVGVDEVSCGRATRISPWCRTIRPASSCGAPKEKTPTPSTVSSCLPARADLDGQRRSGAIEAMSMDMGAAFDKSARKPGHATNAVLCYDPFHVVQLVTAALVLLG